MHADVLIPNDAIAKILKNAEATKIVYSKSTGISSSFGEQDEKASAVSAPAEVGLVVKGENTKTYRDALAKALRSEPKAKLFTVKVRHEGPDGTSTFVEETFDDVQVVFDDATGQTRYSISQETIPRVRFEKTNEINAVYYALDEDDREKWPQQLLEGASKDVLRLVAEISQRM